MDKKADFDLFRCGLAYLAKLATSMSTTHLVLEGLFDVETTNEPQ